MKHRSDPAPRPSRRGLSALWMFLGAIVLAVVVSGGCAVSAYNGLVSSEEAVEKQWSEIQNQYKRRLDLVPQLVSTVKGAANFEQETITAVTNARASVGKVQLPNSLAENPAAAEQFLAAQGGLSSALSRLMVVAEKYPDLRATEAFRDLQSQLEGTENRIAVARGDYITAVERHNTNVRKFPNSFIASFGGFERLPQFEPEEANVDEVPTIDFGE